MADLDDYSDMDDEPCPDCVSWHEGGRCGHDQTAPCRFCTRPVGPLSTGGPNVCALCEVRGVPTEIIMGRRRPYDFHPSDSAISSPEPKSD